MNVHIACVADGIPSEQCPLQGIFAWDQAKALSRAGVEVDFWAVDLRSIRRFRPWGIRHGETDGVRWHSIAIPVGPVPLTFFCKIGTLALRKLFKNTFEDGAYAPDIIHAHFTEIGYMASALAVTENIPLVITEHSSAMVQPVISEGLRRIALRGYRGAKRVLAVSDFLKQSIYRHTGVVAEIVPNIVSTEFHYEKHNQHHGMNFISVANLNVGKRIDVLLRAFAAVSSVIGDVALEIVGDGNQRKHLEQLAKELCIDEKVKFHGVLPRQKIAVLYRECDCFVLPSAFETFGVAYIEAMAAGLPVIATRCGGPEDFVTEENGLLVDVDDVEALKDAMLFMYSARAQYDSEKIAATTTAKFSASAIAGRLLDVYDEVLRRN